MATRALVTIVANKGGDSGEHNVMAYGAVGDGVTDDRTAIYNAGTAATADGGYVYFPKGTYKVSSNLTLSSETMFTEGGVLSIDTSIVVTITGNITAKAFQIFSGAGTVSFLGNYVETQALPQWWGVKGDAGTNNTSAFNKCAVACATGGIPLFIPVGTYNIGSTITFATAVDIDCRGTIVYTAATNEPAVIIGNTGANQTRKRIWGLDIQRTTRSDWTNEACIGLLVYNLYESNVYIKHIQDYTIGLQCHGYASNFVYNTINIGKIYNCKISIDGTNTSSGVFNQNKFLGGRIAVQSSLYSGTARYGVRITSTDAGYVNNNNNNFDTLSFECRTDAIPILIEHGTSNKFESCRAEGNSAIVAQCENASANNSFHFLFGTGTLNDLSSLAGSNILNMQSNVSSEKVVVPVYQSGKLSDKAMFQAGEVTLPAPIFYAYYGTLTRGYTSTSGRMALTSAGVGYSTGTLVGCGVRVDTSLHKKFMVTHDGTALRYYIVCYDSNGAHIDADSGTYIWSLSSTQAISATTYFVSSGKCMRLGSDANSLSFNLHDDVKSIDVVFGLLTGETLQSFSVFALNTTYAPPVLDAYEPAGGWGQCQGTAPPTKHWNSYKVNRKLWQAVTATGGYTGWTCVNQKDTTLTAGEPLGETVMVVGDSTSMVALDIVGVLLDDGTIHWTTIASVDTGTQITLTVGLPSAAAATNGVYTNRWLGFGLIA